MDKDRNEDVKVRDIQAFLWIETWKVRGLKNRKGELNEEFDQMEIDIFAINENEKRRRNVRNK